MTSIYCDALDGECFNFGNCDNCNYNGYTTFKRRNLQDERKQGIVRKNE